MKPWLRFLFGAAFALGLAATSVAAPILTPTGVAASPASAAPNQSVTLAVTMTNSGAATPADDFASGGTASISVTFTNTATAYFFTVSGTATAAGAIAGAGGSGTMNYTFTVPTQTTEAGNYSAVVTMSAPSSGTIAGGVLSASSTVLTVTGTPDLQITSITYTSGTNYKGGDVLPMSLTYRNNTSSNGSYNVPWVPSTGASYFRIMVVLSQNATFGDADDFMLTFHDVSTKKNADSSTQTISWSQLLPGNYSGSYYVLAKIDSLGAVTETIENDTTVNGNNIWGDLAGSRLALQPTAFPTAYLVSTTGSASANAYSDNPSVSSDGRYTVFASDATNLISGDTNSVRDIFLFDNNTSTIRRINVSQQGVAATGASNTPVISAAGRYVAFSSEATNLVLNDTNGFSDIFVVDTQNGDISRESIATAGTQSNGASFRPSISSDGRYLVFESSASNLSASATTGVVQIYLRDRTLSTTTLVSFNSAGTAGGNGGSLQAVISSDGTYVAFASDATDLVAGDTNSLRDVFLRNLAGSSTIRVSVGVAGVQAAGGPSRQPSISSDGSYVAFASDATNLIGASDTNGVSDAFVYNRAAATTTRVSVDSSGTQGSDPTSNAVTGSKLGSFNPAISSTGRYVAFVSLDSDLAPGDTYGQYLGTGSGNSSLNTYIHDRDVNATGTFDVTISTKIASVSRFGYQTFAANASQSTAAADIYPAISGDGRWIAVPSDAEGSNGLVHGATNLTSPDANSARDVILIDRRINALPGSATLPTVSITSPGTGSTSLVNTPVTIGASATTTIGVISTVRFYVNGASVGSSTVFPYSTTWTPTAVGTYTLTALGTDSFGNVGASSSVSVTINASPSVSITGPVGGTLVPVNSLTTISASASASTPGATISSVQFFANGVSIGTDTTAPYTASWTPTSSGTYSLTAIATDSASVTATSTAVSVPAGTAPSVSITSPANAATVSVNATQTVLATASSATGVVASVQFFANGTSIGTDSVYPYTASWTPATPGTYSLTAVATDNVGNATTSSANSVTVSATAVTPTISITSPAASAAVALNATTTITVSAASPLGTPTSVQFFAGATLIGTSTTSPFSLAWTPTSAGAVTLTATVTDPIGTTATSAGVAVTVGTGPVVAITAPSAGNIAVNTTNTILATATSAAGNIATVQFFANSVSIGTASTFPYSVSWTPTSAGSYSLTARATDLAGNISTSAGVAITVTTSLAPTVAISSPTAGSTVPINVATTLTATTSTPVGSITSVQYLAGGTPIGTSTTSPFSLAWTPATAGAVSLTATVTNSLGTQTTSAAVAVTVGTGPVVSITSPGASTITVNAPTTILATATSAASTVASVQFKVNGVAINTVSTFPYTTSWTPTVAGSYLLTALATDAAGNQTTSSSVALTVSGSVAPTVSITAPAAAATLPINVATTLTVSAASPVGSVSSVQYFAGATLIGTSTTSPFSLSWTPTTAGAVSLTATVTNNIGTSATSAAVSVNVGTAPTVTITGPGSSTAVPVNTAQTVTAVASGSAPIATVQFFANGVALGADTAFPYAASWTPTATGSYALTALATDTSGNQTTSATVTVTVSSPTPGLPSISVVTPPTGTTFTVNQPVVLSAIASDPDGTVSLVEFLDGTLVVGSKATAPYFTTYTPTTTGAHSFTAVVTDNAGNRVTSAASAVTVAAASGVAPTVALTFNNPAVDSGSTTTIDPAAAVDVSVGSTLILAATGVSQAGTITSVQFFVNGTNIATDAASPFYTTTTLSTLGQVVITARVTDSLGNSVFTVPLFINGKASTTASAGTVTLISPVNGATYSVGENIVFNATHNFGTDTPPKIDFYLNGVQATTVAGSPYQFIRSLTRSGTYDVHAVLRTGTISTVSSLGQITVTSNTAPTVSLTSPTNASTTAIGTAITIDASASDSDGTIQSVQFFANGSLIATDTSFPYGTTFNPAATGAYVLRAIATDNAGNQTLSAAVNVTVSAGAVPTVSVTAPLTASTVAFGSTVPVTATATSNVTGATIASVQFFSNGVSLGTDTTFPYSTTFTPAATGGYAISALAIDTVGNQATSSTVNITVNTNVAPSVSITVPLASPPAANIGVGAATAVTANASDTDGTITSVQFFVSRTGATTPVSIGTVTTAPFTSASITWTPTIADTYTLTAVATDNLGATTTSANRVVTVTGGNAPTVSLSVPSSVAVNSNANITATAAAVASGATIASVQFFANGVSLGADTTYPYAVTFAPVATGSYAITALATDTAGNQTLTAATTVAVATNAQPTVTVSATAASGVGVANVVTATPADSDGTIASVQFFVSNAGATPVALGTVTASPYTVSWTPVIAGSYSLTAIATDNLGAAVTSAAFVVTVSGGNSPTGVAITSPTTGSTSAVSTPVSLTVTATAAGTATIASVQFFANGVSLGTDTTFPYAATFTPTATGTYSLTALATDTAGNQTLSTVVSLTVNATGGTTPTVSITAPSNAAVIVVGTTNAFTANAIANAAGATIANVQFFANNVSLGTDTTVPYSATFSPTAIGAYTLTATATDTAGNQATTTITVTVNDPPSVSITAPAASASVPTGSATMVSATASDSNGTVAQVQFFANGVSIGTDLTSPFSVLWTPTTSGPVSLTAVATDNLGTTTTSSAVAVTVTNAAPVVSVTLPAPAAVLTVGSVAAVNATATDADGSVASVQFFVSFNGGTATSLGTDITSPYAATLTPTATGSYAISAVATDNLGATTTSAVVTVTAAGGTAPTVSIGSPSNLATIAVGSANTVTATASANAAGATIASVQFFANGVSLGTDTTFPYSATFTPTATGTFVLTAVAADTAGNQATSSTVTVTVSANAAPTVAITAPATLSTIAVNSVNTITATATAVAPATIASVQFFANGVSLGTDNTFPFTAPWTPVTTGSYTLTAVATDTTGIQTTSAPVSITVSAGTAPAVSITSPASAAVIPVNTTQTISATATAVSPATIASVQFFANGVSLGTDNTFPYTATWSPVSLGAFSLTAVATDTAGNITTSTAVGVTVTAGTAPTVSITSPANLATISFGTTPTIVANAAATAPATIASVQFFANGVSLGNLTTFPYQVVWNPPATGAYSLTAVATDTIGNQTTSAVISVTVAANVAPAISITAPANLATVGVGVATAITATATDSDGTVSNVQFFVNGTALGAPDTTSPYSASFTPTIGGAYTLTAVATDNLGAQTTSAAISITASGGNAPSVSITAPVTGTNVAVASTNNLAATATSVVGTIASVQFFANGVSLGTDTTFPYTGTWTPVANGTYSLTALATDTSGNQTVSAAVTITVGANALPTVTVTAPANLASVGVGSVNVVTATAGDADGTVASVQFFANGVSLGTDTTSPYSVSWTPTVAGSYAITAVATDNLGATTTSATNTVTVTAGNAPTVTVVAPANGSTIAVNSAQTIIATANAVGTATIASVQFFANGVSLGTDTTFPYTAPWTPVAIGTYAITAIAIDSAGNQATSSSSSITVAAVGAGGAPTVALSSPNSGATYVVGQQIAMGATVGLGSSFITSVQFYVNGVAIGGGSTAPGGQGSAPFFTGSWTPAAPGTYVFTAVVTDASGIQTTSAPISVTVISAPVPTVVIASPSNASSLPVNVAQTVTANVAVTNASVLRVQFFANNVSLGTVTSFPYSVPWTPTSTGSYSIFAVVTNSVGTTVTSAPVVYTVAAGSAPTVSITSPGSVNVGFPQNIIATAAATQVGAVIQSVQFFVNGVALSTDTTFPFTASWTPIVTGTYSLTAVAIDTLGNRATSAPVSVTGNAVSPTSPSVSIVTPTTGTSVQIGTVPAPVVTITASANDPDGTIASVQFFANGISLGTVTTFPYTVFWTPVATSTPGNGYQITAIATDNGGNQTTSAAVIVNVAAAGVPVVNITAPAAASSFPVNIAVPISATAVGSFPATISSVQFFANGVSIGTDATSPYSINWTPTTAGPYTLTAVATDSGSLTGSSGGVSVTVTAGTPPVVAVTNPVAGGSITVNSAQTFSATATATAPATITSVQFIVNGASIGTDTTFPYTQAYTPAALGAYTVTAIAIDSLGNSTTSTAVAFNVVAAVGPSVTITSPAAGGAGPVGTIQTVSATAVPVAPATVTSVQFFANGVSLGTDVTAPFSVTWTPVAGGTATITAVAIDSNGTQGNATPISFTVTTPPPTLTITGPAAGATLGVNTPQLIAATASSSTGTVVKVEFFVNGVSLSTDATFPFTAPWTPATIGTFALSATATDNFGIQTQAAPVTVTVTGGNVPTVSIASPAVGSSLDVGVTQTIVASANAANGTIAKVEFLANGVSLGTDSTFPYNFAWTPAGTGAVSLTAIATDSLGNQTTSAAVDVTVAGVSLGAPSVSLVSPAAGASLPVGSATLIAASAFDSDGTIRSVEFFANNTSLGVDTVYPYNVIFTPSATGNYVLKAVAIDDGGNITTSATVRITVSGGTAPSVAISAPANSTTLGVNAPVTINAAATSSTGFITSVQFFLNGAALSTDSAFPYAAAWAPNALGTYTLGARATDNLGNITDSAPVTVTVGASAAPTVSVTNPTNGSSYTVGANLNLTANAADSDGSITQVQFFVNGVPQGAIDTVSPYTATWSPGSVGNYVLTAQATDNSGNVSTSAPVTVTIGANAPPTVALTSPAAGSYSLGNQVLISATANDADGAIVSVQFFTNGLSLGAATSAPYNVSWRPTLAGTFSLTAVATDNVGNVTTSTPIVVAITGSAAPAVTITNPIATTLYSVGNLIPIAATSSGGNGPTAQMQFFVNGVGVGTDITSPYSAQFTPNAPGTYSFLAIATDSAGLSSSSAAAISITVRGNNAPAVSLTSPPNGTLVNGGSVVNLTAIATDTDGTIASVRFMANGNVVGTASGLPYSAAWVPSAAGNYTVLAQATDDSGNVTNSTAITVTVVSNRAPTVTMTGPSNGTAVRVGSGANLTATATDADGTIASVQFFANGLAVGAPKNTAPYSAQWTPGAEGIYRVTAIAIDNSGAATTSAAITVLAVLPGAGGADIVYNGSYAAPGESGRFSAINVRGKSATFIGFTSTGANRIYFFPSLPLDAGGGFIQVDSVGKAQISGTASDTGISGSMDAGRATFIGPLSFSSASTVASGLYSGNFSGRADSLFVAIVGPDGSITIYTSDGTFRDAGNGTLGTTGNFTITTQAGNRYTGRADPATGFLTGTLTGGPGGTFIAAVSSGVSFSDGFLRNLSTRAEVGVGDRILVAGFTISGDSPKQVLVRAIGPTLGAFGVTGVLADPQLRLSGSGLVFTNDNWGGGSALADASAVAGGFPLAASSRDAALLVQLAPGSYVAEVTGVNNTTGVALLELYDLDTLQPFSANKLTNVATRGFVGAGAQNQLSAGFTVSGNTAKKLLIRAVGPTLGGAPFNFPGTLSDPLLRVTRADDGVVIRENDNWEQGNDTSLLNSAAVSVGAFPLNGGSKDAAVLMNLPPGRYNAQVVAPGSATGVALIEVYEVP